MGRRSRIRSVDTDSRTIIGVGPHHQPTQPARPYRHIWGSSALCVGGLGSVVAVAPRSASRFRAVQGLEHGGRKTGCGTAKCDKHVCEWTRTVVDGSIIVPVRPRDGARGRCGRPPPGYDDQLGGDGGKLSTPARVRFPVKPTRHRSAADTRIRWLSRIEFGFRGPNPSSPSHHSPPAANHHHSQAEPDPHIQQESPIWAARYDDKESR